MRLSKFNTKNGNRYDDVHDDEAEVRRGEPDSDSAEERAVRYRVRCPWDGKNGKELYAFKFCSAAAYQKQQEAKPESPTNSDTE